MTLGNRIPFSASRYAGAPDQGEAYARILSTFRPLWGLDGFPPSSCRGLFSASTERGLGRKSTRLAVSPFLHRLGDAKGFIVQAAVAMGHALRFFLPALCGSRSNRERHMESPGGRLQADCHR